MSESATWIDDTPLWSAIYLSALNFWSSYRIAATVHAPWSRYVTAREGRGYSKQPWWRWPLDVCVIAPLFGFVQAYGCWWLVRKYWPAFPLNWVIDVEYHLMTWADRFSVGYVWLPADSGDPHEVGFHALAKSVQYETDGDGIPRVVARPRMCRYDSLPAGNATTATGGGTWTSSSGSTFVYQAADGAFINSFLTS